jgi:hypothetical protein
MSMTNIQQKQKTRWDAIIAFLRSEIFVLITFVAITFPLMWHTAELLLRVSTIHNSVYAWFFAFGFDLAIFTFAINGRRAQATGLAFGVCVINICFFNLETMYVYFNAQSIGAQLTVRFVVTGILSVMGSYIVHSYVVFFNDRLEEASDYDNLLKSCGESQMEVTNLSKEVYQLKKVKSEYESLKLEADKMNLQNQQLSKQNEELLETLRPSQTDITNLISSAGVKEYDAALVPFTRDGEKISCNGGCKKTYANMDEYSRISKWCQLEPCKSMKQKVNGKLAEATVLIS